MRLVDADKLENYAYEPEFGVKGEIENWIDETDIPWDIKTEYEEELRGLCWKVLKGCMNVIRTEPTAYGVGEVMEHLKSVSIPEDKILYASPDEFGRFIKLKDALEIVEPRDTGRRRKNGG